MDSTQRGRDWIRDLADARAPTRCTAAYELGKARDGVAVEALARALRDGYVSVRRAAAVSLGEIGLDGAVGPLIRALGDDDPEFRAAVVGALGRITKRAFPTPREWVAWYRSAEPSAAAL